MTLRDAETRIELRYLQWLATEAQACGLDPYNPTQTQDAAAFMNDLRNSKFGQRTRDGIALEEHWADLVTAVLAPVERLVEWLTQRLRR